MEKRKALCPENEGLVSYMLNKREEMASGLNGLSENLDMTFQKAYSNVLNSKIPIKNRKDFAQIKGVGKWILRLIQGYFETDSGGFEYADLTKVKKNVRAKRYLPQKNSVAYALLITLYRATSDGSDFMRKQELIDAAEASGLSRVPIVPEKGKRKSGPFGSSPREWYSGWTCMKTLISRGLVVKSSCPAKYMLTEEGKIAARDCLMRSGLADSDEALDNSELSDVNLRKISETELDFNDSLQDKRSLSLSSQCVDNRDHTLAKWDTNAFETKFNILNMPPLRFGERFADVYEVILILDDREQFVTQGSRSRKILENISAQFKIEIEVRRLPIGDGVWIARHKHHGSEYVLDFIVERKKVDDLRCSIRDNRYRDQKLRILRSGLKKVIYMVEGDPNTSEAAESIKTACFTTEILEGFDVQRSCGLGDTLRKYGYLTQSICQYYSSLDCDYEQKSFEICPLFKDFVRRCQDLDKMTISDVLAIQLMQVPQVTEEVALAVLDMYPTLYPLVWAYSNLDGDLTAQEELLKKQSNEVISGAASKNIFHLIWGN